MPRAGLAGRSRPWRSREARRGVGAGAVRLTEPRTRGSGPREPLLRRRCASGGGSRPRPATVPPAGAAPPPRCPGRDGRRGPPRGSGTTAPAGPRARPAPALPRAPNRRRLNAAMAANVEAAAALPEEWQLYLVSTRAATFLNWPFTEGCACTPERVSPAGGAGPGGAGGPGGGRSAGADGASRPPSARRWRRRVSCTVPARTAPTWRGASSASRSWRAGSPTTTPCE